MSGIISYICSVSGGEGELLLHRFSRYLPHHILSLFTHIYLNITYNAATFGCMCYIHLIYTLWNSNITHINHLKVSNELFTILGWQPPPRCVTEMVRHATYWSCILCIQYAHFYAFYAYLHFFAFFIPYSSYLQYGTLTADIPMK